MNIQEEMHALGVRAKAAAVPMGTADTRTKNRALLAIADALSAHETEILAANGEDILRAEENLSLIHIWKESIPAVSTVGEGTPESCRTCFGGSHEKIIGERVTVALLSPLQNG